MSTDLRSTSAKDHLKWDIQHGFIQIIAGDRTDNRLYYKNNYLKDTIWLLVDQNPKAQSSRAHHIFAMYRDGMTVEAFVREHDRYELLKAFDGPLPSQKPVVRRKTDLLPGFSGHSYWASRVREILTNHIADLGGIDTLSEAEKSILRRAAVLTIEAERLERRFASIPMDKPITQSDLSVYAMLANSLRRLLDMTGLERRTKSLTPTIDEYVRSRASDDPVVDVTDPSSLREAAE